MSSFTISDPRPDELPLPYVDTPMGWLEYDGHEVTVWSIATTAEGKVICLNCSAADAASSATLRRLLRNSGGKATFRPAKGVRWPGPTELSKLADHYETITQALTHKGMRLKNQCIIPDCLNIAAGLSRPLEAPPTVSLSAHLKEEKESGDASATEETSDEQQPDTAQDARSFRYILGDVTRDRPPLGALFAHVQSLVVVCHPTWEATLWEYGKQRTLIVPQPALGIHAWSLTRERERWTALVGELWMRGMLARPEPTPLLAVRTRRSPRSSSARK